MPQKIQIGEKWYVAATAANTEEQPQVLLRRVREQVGHLGVAEGLQVGAGEAGHGQEPRTGPEPPGGR